MAQNEKDWVAKDADKIASYYSDDASVLAPDTKTITGMADIKVAVKQFLDLDFTYQAGPSIKVDVSKAEDLAYAEGTEMSQMSDPKTKKAMKEEGKWVTVFKKQADGRWKAVADIFNADGPAVVAK